MKLITLEEHFFNTAISAAAVKEIDRLAPSYREAYSGGRSHSPSFTQMTDLGADRLANMDANGIDMQILSTGGPGIQLIRANEAVPLAIDANDQLAEAIKLNPTRFGGLATLPTSNPEASALELTRTITKLGFKGAVISGATNDKLLDDKSFEPILEAANRLEVPIYLHPTIAVKAVRDAYYSGIDPIVDARLASAAWGWHMETGVHIIRMILAGVFEKYPKLQMIIGHWGEMIPFYLARIDQSLPKEITHLPKSVSEYFLNHVYVTPSGMFTLPPFMCTLQVMGADRIMYSVDYPYIGNEGARAFLENAPISPADQEKIANGNVRKLLKL